jgi:hypothetical protein
MEPRAKISVGINGFEITFPKNKNIYPYILMIYLSAFF